MQQFFCLFLLEKAIPAEKSTLEICDLFKQEKILKIRNFIKFLFFLYRSVPSVFAARAVDLRLQAKGGMHSGLTISHCATIVPNSLLKVPPKSQFYQLLDAVLVVLEVN